MIELLVSRGADVNLPGRDARTPLAHALQIGDAAIIALLRTHGAVVGPTNQGGFSESGDRRGNGPE